MTDFIRRLYHVDISEYRSFPPDPCCSEEAEELYMKLKKTLSNENSKLFEDYVNAAGKTAAEDQYLAFSKGITMAVQLIIGALAEN